MSESGWVTFPDVPEWWEALLDVREALPVVRVWSGDPYRCPVVVVVSPKCPGVVGRLCRMSGNG